MAENVFCKISGMITEAGLEKWTKAELRPYLDTVVEAFWNKTYSLRIRLARVPGCGGPISRPKV
jgi:hypothetical protein